MEHGDAALTDVRQQAAAGCDRPDLCSALATMSKANAPAARTAGTTTDAPTDNQSADLPPTFGIDAQGRNHRWSRSDDRIVVTADGQPVHVEAVTETRDVTLVHDETGEEFTVPKTVADWVQFIDDRVAWVGTWLDADGWAESMRRREAAEAKVEADA